LVSDGGPALPFVEGLPCGLEGADDSFFEVGRVLLHDDDGFLEKVFFVDLFEELTCDEGVGDVGIGFVSYGHWGILVCGDAAGEFGDVSC
jgi:hypothetical protein